jgi:DNA-directed RNA polymerase specialized sigma24 family protein
LRDYEGLEWRDVAKELGKNTDSAARELHRRALLLVAKCLKSKGIEIDPN